MEELNEQYNKYLTLTDEKEMLNTEVKKLIGKNDEESIEKLSELGNKIAQVDTQLSMYDNKTLETVKEYFNILKELEKINEEIKLIEKYSKKVTHNNDKTAVLSAENRKKLINKEDAARYQSLADQKRNLRNKVNKIYRTLKDKTTMIKEESKTVQNTEPLPIRVSPVFYYDSLSLDEKIEETRKRLDRIFQSRYLPNQGKKIIVTYDGKKHTIPEKYKGRFHSTTAELNKLLKEKNKENTIETVEKMGLFSKDSMPVEVNSSVGNNMPLFICSTKEKEETNIVPKSTNINEEIEENKEEKETKKEQKHKIISIYNIDKKANLVYQKTASNLLDAGIVLKTAGVNIAKEVIPKYNTAKTFVKKTSKEIAKKTVEIYNEIRKSLSTKGEIISNMKSGSNLQESMEKVYGEEKEEHMDYIIVNRTVNFNKNMCQRVNTVKGNITKVSKKVIDTIKIPFDYLRESMYDDIKRAKLDEEIQKIKQEKLNKKEELKRIKIKSESGYIAMGTLIIVGIVALSAIIFTIVNNILG